MLARREARLDGLGGKGVLLGFVEDMVMDVLGCGCVVEMAVYLHRMLFREQCAVGERVVTVFYNSKLLCEEGERRFRSS